MRFVCILAGPCDDWEAVTAKRSETKQEKKETVYEKQDKKQQRLESPNKCIFLNKCK